MRKIRKLDNLNTTMQLHCISIGCALTLSARHRVINDIEHALRDALWINLCVDLRHSLLKTSKSKITTKVH